MEAKQTSQKGAQKMDYTTSQPEMGIEAPQGTEIEATLSHGGGYYVSTELELSGRGIKSAGQTDGKRRAVRNTYHVTKLAFAKLCKAHRVNVESLLS